MRPWRQFSVLLAPVLLLSACGLSFSGGEIYSPTPLTTAPASPVTGPLAEFYNQQVKWVNCGLADCTTIAVPVDYADPEGPTVDLAATRVAATGTPSIMSSVRA